MTPGTITLISKKWRMAFEENNIDPDFYSTRERSCDELLPWAHINTGVSSEYLLNEYKKSLQQAVTEDCRNFLPRLRNPEQLRDILQQDQDGTIMRIRITHSKSGNLIYTGNLDMQRIWERGIRRANLNLTYSKGFHPQPRIQIANPLPLGFSGSSEIVDVWLDEDKPVEEIRQSLIGKFPDGLEIHNIKIIPDNAPKVVNLVAFSDYILRLTDPEIKIEDIEKKIRDIMKKTSIPRVRRNKPYDLRPLIASISLNNEKDERFNIGMRLSSRPGKTGRPEEVMLEMEFQLTYFSVERVGLILESNSMK